MYGHDELQLLQQLGNNLKLKNIYEALADEKSKHVFFNTILMIRASRSPYKAKALYYANDMREECDRVTKFTVQLDDRVTVPVIADSNQYYPKGIIELSQNEGFLDAGMYDGGTVLQFIEKCNGQYEAIYAFEASRANFENRKEVLKGDIDPRIELFNVGLSSYERTAYFPKETATGARASNVAQENMEECILKPLDSVLTPEKMSKITFVKMDIEGAEMEVLNSIKNLIINNKPKLAISVYHNPDDIMEIPMFIHSIVPEYKLYLRHHTSYIWETILYAVL